jgi:hypothetical protein
VEPAIARALGGAVMTPDDQLNDDQRRWLSTLRR